MKFIVILFCFISTLTFSQTHRFIYEFEYQRDSLSDHKKKIEMILDIHDKQTLFYEAKAIKIDSINKNSSNFSRYTFPFVKLKRNISSQINMNYDFINDNYFVFETNDKIVWQIKSDTKNKENWTLQKANAKFGGRNWEAWFTTDIPFSEGPYKFTGLPGLIVELKDSEGYFSYTLKSVEKPKNFNPNILETLFNEKPVVVSFEKYKSILIAYYNDPFARFRNMKPGTWAIGRSDKTYVDTLEGLAKITKEEQENIRKNNNPLEIDKAVQYGK